MTTTIAIKAQVKKKFPENGHVMMAILGDMSKLKENEVIELKLKRSKRTLSQNALYWAFMQHCAEYMAKEGHFIDFEEVHEAFKSILLSQPHQTPSGKTIKLIGTTTTMSISAFSEYLEKCFALAIDWGIPVELFTLEHKDEINDLKNRV